MGDGFVVGSFVGGRLVGPCVGVSGVGNTVGGVLCLVCLK